MSNFRIKKQITRKFNIKDSNTLEVKHRQKITQIENKKISYEKLQTQLNKINDDLFNIDKMRESNHTLNLEKRATLLNDKKKLEEELDIIKNKIDEINYYDLTGDLLNE